MPTKEQVTDLVAAGHGYPDAARILGIPPGLAYLIATGIPADGGDSVTAVQRHRPGVLAAHSQRLVNPRQHAPGGDPRVRDWVRRRAHADLAAPAPPADQQKG